MLRPELRAAAQTALFQAQPRGPPRPRPAPSRWCSAAKPASVTVRARPAPGTPARPDRVRRPRRPPPATVDAVDPDHALALALRQTQEQLQVSVEEFETSREELRAQNEELQSINEELRSTAEELETSKEEAQSMSEELRTVNDELKAKVDETARAKGDLENLIVSTEIATLFLDRQLCASSGSRPTCGSSSASRRADVGRPARTTWRSGSAAAGLSRTPSAVIDRLDAKEREVEGEDGRWYWVRTRPYRTVQDHIDGVVITFVDITQAQGRRGGPAPERGPLPDPLRVHRRGVLRGRGHRGRRRRRARDDYRFIETNPAFEQPHRARGRGRADDPRDGPRHRGPLGRDLRPRRRDRRAHPVRSSESERDGAVVRDRGVPDRGARRAPRRPPAHRRQPAGRGRDRDPPPQRHPGGHGSPSGPSRRGGCPSGSRSPSSSSAAASRSCSTTTCSSGWPGSR